MSQVEDDSGTCWIWLKHMTGRTSRDGKSERSGEHGRQCEWSRWLREKWRGAQSVELKAWNGSCLDELRLKTEMAKEPCAREAGLKHEVVMNLKLGRKQEIIVWNYRAWGEPNWAWLQCWSTDWTIWWKMMWVENSPVVVVVVWSIKSGR